ncbi:hypothetical protein H0H92_013101 [Tricholoma furcatifolium]|nr:hypothetical protein H0H92_013101 [Tricholoma furcatifolium]
MLSRGVLISALSLALVASANPVVVRESLVKLPLTRRVNATSIHNLVRHDVNRAKALRARAEARLRGESDFDARTIIEEGVDNQAVQYIASIGVGTPATTYQLIVDTGSSNTWVGATAEYVRTSSSVETGDGVSVTYGSGSFSGTEFVDTVTIASSLVITGQSIGVASSSDGFEGVDGIIGIGPVDLTEDTLTSGRETLSTLIPTVTDNAFSQGLITADSLGISFEPTTSSSDLNGEISWGTLADFYEGTTLLLIASNAFSAYQSATGAVVDERTDLLRLTSTQFANLQSLFFTTNGVTLELTANAQLWPRALNTAIGGVASDIYLIVGNLGTPSGEGFDFVNGLVFLERFYAVFDTANRQVGFATTSFTDATTN